MKIHRFLRDAGTYGKAFKMLDSVLEIFGDVEELQVSSEELETIKIKKAEETEEEEDDDEDSEVQEQKGTRFVLKTRFLNELLLSIQTIANVFT